MARLPNKNVRKKPRSPGRFAQAVIESSADDSATSPVSAAQAAPLQHRSSRRDTTKIRRAIAAIQGFSSNVGSRLSLAFHWLIAQRWLPLAIVLLGSLLVALGARSDAPEAAASLKWENTTWFESPEAENADVFFSDTAFGWAWKHFSTLLLWLAPAGLIGILQHRGKKQLALVATVSVVGLAAYLTWDVFTGYRDATTSFQGEATTKFSYFVKLGLVSLVILSPPIVLWLYNRANTFDRYVVRSFLTPFTLCLAGFISIWFIIDLADNGPDFIDAEIPPTASVLIGFYLARLPQIIVLTLDISILLATLYTLGRMSRTNEFISMLGAGIGTPRILVPIFSIAAYATLISLTMNYEWAPQAERQKEELLQSLDEKNVKKSKTSAQRVLFVNREANRIWYVGSIPIDIQGGRNKMSRVEVIQLDENGEVEKTWSANRASWFEPGGNVKLGIWNLFDCTVRENFDDRGIAVPVFVPRLALTDVWEESPWKLQSQNLNPEYLGVPELRSYLRTNAELPESELSAFKTQKASRIALPFRCLIIALVAAPLGIVYSRRGVLGGVASCVFIYFLIHFFTAICLAFGSSGRMWPVASAWAVNIVAACVGLTLLYFRSRNRDIPSIASLFKRRPT
ncbi:LptF/LptG family permease [Verrucomicrobiales bacterium]|nr:LptF/LptG family permease [Verrucomicrobiales bacterium]